MNQPTRISLVRHGETIWNREQRLQGSRDIPLNEIGIAQAARVAERLLYEQHHHVYSSHLKRAYDTAAAIAEKLGLPHHVHDRLHERSYGQVEGLTRAEILARYPNFWEPGSQLPIPGLETSAELRQRVYAAVDEIARRHPGENVLIVSHGGSINAFLHAVSNGLYGSGVNKLGNTSITRVLREANGQWKIESIGDDSHLQS